MNSLRFMFYVRRIFVIWFIGCVRSAELCRPQSESIWLLCVESCCVWLPFSSNAIRSAGEFSSHTNYANHIGFCFKLKFELMVSFELRLKSRNFSIYHICIRKRLTQNLLRNWNTYFQCNSIRPVKLIFRSFWRPFSQEFSVGFCKSFCRLFVNEILACFCPKTA